MLTAKPSPVHAAVLVLLIAVGAFLAMGYHPGAEDDAVYLAAVEHRLNQTLFPHDAAFFTTELQATVFDTVIATPLRGIPHTFGGLGAIDLARAELLWHLLSLLVLVSASRLILCRLFADEPARWAGVALLASMFTLPVAGTALYIADWHLHPRNLATALILLAVERVLARRWVVAGPLLACAVVIHPIMGTLGASFCLFQTLARARRLQSGVVSRVAQLDLRKVAMGAVPLGWVFERPTPDWRQTMATRGYYFLYQWRWYEWLGAIAPLILFWLLARWARRRADEPLHVFATGVLWFGIFQQLVAMLVCGPDALIRLVPLQPMRYLHLVYVMMTLIGGALMGRFLLRRSTWRWVVFVIVAFGGMFVSQRLLFAGSPHIELPGGEDRNPWLQTFAWVREHTPVDATFALDPRYMMAPGENFHSFRALAERSVLADAIKDAAVTTQVPELAAVWHRQQQAQAGWSRFQLDDFERLRRDEGVTWVVVRFPHPPTGLDCLWHNDQLTVCRIP